MAIKFSDQTAASALDGTETVPVVQGGNSRRSTIAAIVTWVRAVFAATPVTVLEGGTGSTTAAGARTNLGLGVQSAKGSLIGATAANTPVDMPIGSDGQALAADSSQTNGLVYIDNPSRSNLLINPNWQIDQINEGALYTASGGVVTGPDGWSGAATGAGAFKIRTLADPSNAALKCLEITCTTADAALAASDNYRIYTAIEGYDAPALMWGTSSAIPITIQFKWQTNTVGTYYIAVVNSAGTRSNRKAFVVADTSEHEYSITFDGDTTGTWLYTNGAGIYLIISLAAGTDLEGTAGTWSADGKTIVAGAVNFMASTSSLAYLKRIQLIPGSLVQAYKPADIQKELAKCQRYYAKTFIQGTAPVQGAGGTNAIWSDYAYANGAGCVATWCLPVTMRAAPAVITYNVTSANANWRNIGNSADANLTPGTAGTTFVNLQADTDTVGGNGYQVHATANARLS